MKRGILGHLLIPQLSRMHLCEDRTERVSWYINCPDTWNAAAELNSEHLCSECDKVWTNLGRSMDSPEVGVYLLRKLNGTR